MKDKVVLQEKREITGVTLNLDLDEAIRLYVILGGTSCCLSDLYDELCRKFGQMPEHHHNPLRYNTHTEALCFNPCIIDVVDEIKLNLKL